MLRPPFQVQGASSSIRLLPSGTRAGNRGRQSNARMGTRNRHRSRASRTRQLHTHPPRQRAAGKGFLSPHQRAWRPKAVGASCGNGRVFFFFRRERRKQRRERSRELMRSHPSPRCRKIPKRKRQSTLKGRDDVSSLPCIQEQQSVLSWHFSVGLVRDVCCEDGDPISLCCGRLKKRLAKWLHTSSVSETLDSSRAKDGHCVRRLQRCASHQHQHNGRPTPARERFCSWRRSRK